MPSIWDFLISRKHRDHVADPAVTRRIVERPLSTIDYKRLSVVANSPPRTLRTLDEARVVWASQRSGQGLWDRAARSSSSETSP